MIKALVWLFVGVAALVVSGTGYAVQYTVFGWDVIALSPAERLLAAPIGVALTAVGLLLVYRRQ